MSNDTVIIKDSLTTLLERADKAILSSTSMSPVDLLSAIVGIEKADFVKHFAAQSVAAQPELVTIIVTETDGDNDRVVNTYSRNAIGFNNADREMVSIFESEMGDHDSVLSELLELNDLSHLDHTDIQEQVDEHDVSAVVEWIAAKLGAQGLLNLLPAITYGRVQARVESEHLNLNIRLNELSIVNR
ncbi:hypothetical protein [Neptuniibacter sp. QD37_11]|uniref:hypothetical protein n=1 Tax=Neptuniibacter sp. QD37_11 TaxID=3398209 RepID=UPI0039F56BEF